MFEKSLKKIEAELSDEKKDNINITLSERGLRDKDIEKLVTLLKRFSHKKIHYLTLSGNNIGDKGGEMLASLTNVRELHVGYNRIEDASAKLLVLNSSIKILILSDNLITDACASFIEENTKQDSLDLYRTEITRENLKKIEEATQRNKLKRSYLEESDQVEDLASQMAQLGILRSPGASRESGKERKDPSPTGPSPREKARSSSENDNKSKDVEVGSEGSTIQKSPK